MLWDTVGTLQYVINGQKESLQFSIKYLDCRLLFLIHRRIAFNEKRELEKTGR